MSATNDALIEFVRGWGFSGLADALAAADASEALTPLGMFMDADWVVKSVMLGLIGASVLAWAVWAGKLVQIAVASARLGRDYRRLAAQGRLGADLPRKLRSGERSNPTVRSIEPLIDFFNKVDQGLVVLPSKGVRRG